MVTDAKNQLKKLWKSGTAKEREAANGLMHTTFPDRRELVVTQELEPAELLDHYPWLQKPIHIDGLTLESLMYVPNRVPIGV